MKPADVGDGGRRPGRAVAGQDVEGVHVPVEPGLLGGGQVEVVHAELAGLREQRVVDVGDVAHALGVVAQVAQAALQHVVEQVDGRVAEVGGVVGRDAARVHGDDRSGLEGHDLLAGGVVQAHDGGHRSGLDCRAAQALMPVSFGRHPGPVADVELQQHGREGLDGRGVGQLAGVERTAAGDGAHDLRHDLDGVRCRPSR